MQSMIASAKFVTVLLMHIAVAGAQNATPSPDSIIWEPWRNSAATVLLDQGSKSTRARFNIAGDLVAVTSGDAVAILRVSDGQLSDDSLQPRNMLLPSGDRTPQMSQLLIPTDLYASMRTTAQCFSDSM